MKKPAVNGVNFADTYYGGGASHPGPVPPCPMVIGFEAAGVVEGVGPEVSALSEGQRVA